MEWCEAQKKGRTIRWYRLRAPPIPRNARNAAEIRGFWSLSGQQHALGDATRVLPGIIGVTLFGFTLSYDEFPRSWVTVGPKNTLPLEIWGMTTNITSPALYALGTVTTAISFIVIGISLISIGIIQSRRARRRIERERAMGL